MSSAQALTLLQLALRSEDPDTLRDAVKRLQQEGPREPLTFFAQSEMLRRQGRLAEALGVSASAMAALLGPRVAAPDGRVALIDVLGATLALAPADVAIAMPYLHQFGGLLERAGVTQALAPSFAPIAASILDPRAIGQRSPMHAEAVLALLGLSTTCALPWASQVFEELLVPWMHASAESGPVDTAIALESIACANHLKRLESQAWFKATTGRWLPGLAQRIRGRPEDPAAAHGRWRREPVRRVALFVHRASLLAHIVVMLETLAAVRGLGARNYAFTVFVWSGRHPPMETAFTQCGVAVRYLDEADGAGAFERIRTLRRVLAAENFAACFWVSHIALLAFAFPLRIAPVQGWWAMKYHACEVDGIDAHLAVESVVTEKTMEGIRWRTSGFSSTRWVDPGLVPEAVRIRSSHPPGTVIAACIGREEKLDSPEFIDVVCGLLRRHPNLVFLWTGRTAPARIRSAFERAGVADRARFVGWVPTKLYAHVMDLFLDSFPFPCGMTLKEAMAAGKPAILYRSPESLETGVPGAITPLIEGSADAPPEARRRLRDIFTRGADYDLYLCADSPAAYAALASRAIEDASLRAAAGAANRRFVEAFLSAPEAEAAKFLDHLDQWIDAAPSTP